MKLGSYRGIGVYIHWSFWLLVAVYLVSATARDGLWAGLIAVAFVLSVFVCVLLHEFGHALSAAAFGIKTQDITLLPIGGVARLVRLPEKPYQELIVALAGPAVNVVIAGLLGIPLVLGVLVQHTAPRLAIGGDFITQLLVVNLLLVGFNLLPAFPMDGGRVLRSLLAMRWGNLRATEIAARVGRWMALFFAVYGIIYGPIELLLIAVFILFAGTAELMGVRFRAMQQAGGAGSSGAFRGAVFQGGQWQQLWPDTQPEYGAYESHSAGAEQHGSVIDAVQVKHIDKPHSDKQ